MTNVNETRRYSRTPYLVVFEDAAGPKDAYGGLEATIALESHLLKPEDTPSDTVTIFMHPLGTGHYLPMPSALASSGLHTIFCGTRYHGADYGLIMEKVVVDLGACIRHAKEQLGYKNVVLAGWSGGGSLALFYQSQAENPTVVAPPGGGGPNLTQAKLIPADGVILPAAHVARAKTLTEWLDPSILGEDRPLERDPELNLYHAANPNQAPYSDDYIARYREAQIARNRRITERVKRRLQQFKDAGEPDREYSFTVHGTMADPRWLDPAIDPNERKPGWCYLGDPRIVNDSPIGLARYSSLKSWLSQWSYDDSNADGEASAARITVPVLVIGNGADDACTPSHAKRLYEAIGHERKVRREISGATHYYFGQKEKVKEAADLCKEWIGGLELA